MEQTFQNVVKEYRRLQGLSVRGFAEKLTEKMVNTSLKGATVHKWETKPNHAPDLYLFFNLVSIYTDWRAQFGVDSLKAIMPHVFNNGLITFHIPKLK